ncbi:MAG: hypothetical protein KBG07_05800 [Elusimicrobia bacterium]|jgi:hypothetical protein|nr:hypothetical protein [Elusimicrobiota bacterium]
MRSTWIKRSAWLVLVLGIAGIGRTASPQPGEARDFGVGVILGDPTGLSAKYWLTHKRAVDMALAWDLSGSDDRLEIHADHLWHFDLDISRMQGRLPLYVGLGGRVLTGHDARVGVRVPLGISYMFPRIPIELFGEITPLLDFTPDTDTSVNGGAGIRFYFKG